MLKIQNKEKLVGEFFEVGLDLWRVEGVYDYPPEYHIHLRTSGSKGDKLFIVTKEENFVEWNANYKITDRDDPMSSVWVHRYSISSTSSILRTLKRIISHANN